MVSWRDRNEFALSGDETSRQDVVGAEASDGPRSGNAAVEKVGNGINGIAVPKSYIAESII